MAEQSTTVVPLIIRGRVIESDLIDFGVRNGDASFRGPDPRLHTAELSLSTLAGLRDLDALDVDEILEFLVEVGERLDVESNEHLKSARALSYAASPNTRPLVDMQFRRLRNMFSRGALSDYLKFGIDRRYLDGWVEHDLHNGDKQFVHAFGSRAVHISAGNGVGGAALAIIRSALTRGDAILKSPSNDPMTAVALALTLCDVDSTHPVTRHVSVAYWRGGDADVETAIYHPNNIEKIVAWGGHASVKHVVGYLQPGVELIQFDPKRSISIVDLGPDPSDEVVDDAAHRLALDIGKSNQNACTSARVALVVSGTDAAGLGVLHTFADRTYAAMVALPEEISTAPKRGIDPELRGYLDTARLNSDFYRVTGGSNGEGAIVESLFPDPVDFAGLLIDRVANLVPIDSIEDAFTFFDSYTQTVGVYPPELAVKLRREVGLYGGQRVIPLGHATPPMFQGPQDAFEPLRRLCRWVTAEEFA